MGAEVPPNALHIERLHNDYLVPEGESASWDIGVLGEAALAHLKDSLASRMKRCISTADPSLWFVRRLELDFPLNPDTDPSAVGGVFASNLVERLVAALHGTENDGGVLHFPDRAAYLAHFLVDAARGLAWEKWYYGPFNGLRSLSTSAALRTAILDNPATGFDALAMLPENDCRAIVAALAAADANRILASAPPCSPEAGESAVFAALAEFWRTVPFFDREDEERRALMALLTARRRAPAAAGPTLAPICRALARLDNLLGGVRPSPQLEIVLSGDISRRYAAFGARDAGLLEPLTRCDPAVLTAIFTPKSGDDAATRWTQHGGIFLLLPLLDELPLDTLTAGWPEPEGAGRVPFVRALIAVKCLGGPGAAARIGDPVVRDWLQLPPELTLEDLAGWISHIHRRHLDAFLRALFEWRYESGILAGETFTVRRVRGKRGSLAIVADSARDLWLSVAPHIPEWQRDAAVSETASGEVERDLSYLGLPAAWHVRGPVDRALSVAAQGVLRCFAWKLPGFAQSSLNYLASNFLSLSAAVEEGESHFTVTLANPPLHIVLGLAGLNRCSYTLRWTGKPCHIFPET